MGVIWTCKSKIGIGIQKGIPSGVQICILAPKNDNEKST